jgi:DNA-binding response OmpR family regulator
MALAGKGSVLVVDDEESVLTTVQGILAEAGFEAVATSTCSEALDRLRQQSFDVVLSDVRLVDGDGLRVVEEARRRSPPTPAILLTGYGSLESAIGALRCGVNDYLQKPCKVEDLQRSVSRAIEEHQALKQREQRRIDLAAANAGLVAMNADLQRRVDSLLSETRARSRMLRAVAEAGRVLVTADDATRSLEEAARLVVPALSDACGVYGEAEEQQVRLLAFADIDPEREQTLLGPRRPVDLHGDGEVACVLRTCEPILLEDIDAVYLASRSVADPSTDLLLALRPRSALFVPVIARGQVQGVLVLANQSPERRFGLDELAIAESLAARTALVLAA